MSSGEKSAIAVPVATATPVEMVEVVAPATLAGGYTFQAIYNGVTFPVTVPPGGVQKDQRIRVPFTSQDASTELTPVLSSGYAAPRGHWKDGLCDCCRFGILHPSFLNAWCCPQILMAQVLTRMKMTWLGAPAEGLEWRKTFRTMLIIVIAYFVFSCILAPPMNEVVVNDEGEVDVTLEVQAEAPLWQTILYNLLGLSFGLYTLIVLTKLRHAVRTRYEIPEQRCFGWEDLCCSFWCGCCTVSQLARHTANYNERRAICCSDTGLPATTPVLVV